MAFSDFTDSMTFVEELVAWLPGLDRLFFRGPIKAAGEEDKPDESVTEKTIC
jgi:hypothetical protein